MSFADRGKVGEKKFKDMCEKSSKLAAFAYYRFPDARAGSRSVVPADFDVEYNGKNFKIEVKETVYPNRLPKGNVDPAQLARLKRYKLAGSLSYVLIYHSTLDMWRYREVSDLPTLPPGVGSWKLDDTPVMTLEEVFRQLGLPT